MKLKLLASILALSAFSWAQSAASPQATATQATTNSASAATKAECPCCQKMADNKATMPCCAHHEDGAAKSEMSCCKGMAGKDAMSCMKGDKGKSPDASSPNGKCCGGSGKESCCSKSEKATEQAAMSCCGANGEKCGMAHHDHADMNK